MPRKPTGQILERRGKRGTTTFALRFRAYGKREYLTLGTAEAGWTRDRAQEELENVLADVRRGIWTSPSCVPEPPQRSDQVFHEFASDWLDARREELRPNTILDYSWQLSNHLLPFFAGHRLDEITVAEVDRFKTQKLKQGALSATSINKCITRLASVLEDAVEYGLIERNPAKGRRRRVKASTPPRPWLDRADQISSLLEAAGALDRQAGEGHRRALLATLTFAGLRISEAMNLRWREVDLPAGRLRVTDSKTAAGVRTVDLLPVLREELITHKAGLRDPRPDDLVFATSTGRPQNPSNLRNRVLRRAVRIADDQRARDGLPPLPDRVTPHALRRTYASILVALGADPTYVMQQLGHSDPKMTLGLYARVMQRGGGERDRLKALVAGSDHRDELHDEAFEQTGSVPVKARNLDTWISTTR